MQQRLLILACVLAGTAAARNRIGPIEYFGTQGLDMAKIRSATPVKTGDAYSDKMQARVRKALNATEVANVCCDENGDILIFIGLNGASAKPFAYNPPPTGKQRLPSSIAKLSASLDKAVGAAAQKGGTAVEEDDSNGYALIKDPAARAIQLRIREWALLHETEAQQVLQYSSAAKDRAIAAEVLGYAKQSPQQIGALVEASRDPDEGVRNNATRALGVLVRSNAALAASVDSATFIAMLSSGVWTDRNKAAMLLAELTSQRPAELLAEIRAKVLYSLMEMAAWRRASHAYFARMILGRVASIPEAELAKLAWDQPEAILEAASKLSN